MTHPTSSKSWKSWSGRLSFATSSWSRLMTDCSSGSKVIRSCAINFTAVSFPAFWAPSKLTLTFHPSSLYRACTSRYCSDWSDFPVQDLKSYQSYVFFRFASLCLNVEYPTPCCIEIVICLMEFLSITAEIVAYEDQTALPRLRVVWPQSKVRSTVLQTEHPTTVNTSA